jgi:hypothetical protein
MAEESKEISEDRALPGRRMAKRIDATLGTRSIEDQFGGEGDGRKDKPILTPDNKGDEEY